MINRIIAIVSALVILVATSSLPVRAESNNFAVGAIVNLSTFDTTGTELEGDTNAFSDRESTGGSHSKDVDFASLFAEYSVMSDQYWGVTLGLEWIPDSTEIGSKVRSDTVSDSTETSTDTGDYTAKARVSDHMAIYLEPTIGTDMFGIYAKGGFARVTVETLESIDVGTDSSAYGDEGVFGVMYGLGVKYKHSSGFFVKLEDLQIDYDSVSLRSTSGNQNLVTAKPEQESTRIAIGFAF